MHNFIFRNVQINDAVELASFAFKDFVEKLSLFAAAGKAIEKNIGVGTGRAEASGQNAVNHFIGDQFARIHVTAGQLPEQRAFLEIVAQQIAGGERLHVEAQAEFARVRSFSSA